MVASVFTSRNSGSYYLYFVGIWVDRLHIGSEIQSMMHWIVLWTLLTYVPTECPDFKPNPYTGEYPMTHCLVNHQKQVTKHFKRRFNTQSEAISFINKAPDDVKPSMKIEKVPDYVFEQLAADETVTYE